MPAKLVKHESLPNTSFVLLCQVILVDRVGRRTLMLAGLAGMFLSYGIITIAYALQVNCTKH